MKKLMDVRISVDQIRLKQNLTDAGCSNRTIDEITGMCESGNMEGALHLMKKDRCRLMDELHERKSESQQGDLCKSFWHHAGGGHVCT